MTEGGGQEQHFGVDRQREAELTQWYWRLRGTYVRAAFLILLTALAYAMVYGAGFVWDDNDYVTNNQTLLSLGGLKAIWLRPGAVPQYYPLVHTTFWLEYRLWKLDALGYHVTNILLHCANALLGWYVLSLLRIRSAWLIAMIFAVHPVHVESVAWITERKNVLSGFFYLAALASYIRSEMSEQRGRRWYAASLVLFVCALLSKTVTCTLPAVLLLLAWYRRGAIRVRDVVRALPFFAAGFSLALVTVHLEGTVVGAAGDEWSLSWLDRCLIAGRALWFYVGKLLWPAKLSFIYPRWDIDPSDMWSYVYPVAALLAVFQLWLWRDRLGRGPVMAVAFFAISLLPALGFVNVYPMRYSFVADHYQYLASLGIIALVVGGADRLLRNTTARRAGFAAAALAVSLLASLTLRQGLMYKDVETLWRWTIQANPQAWIAHNNLGAILVQKGERAVAEEHFATALVCNPRHVEALHNMGNCLMLDGDEAGAAECYRRALEIAPNYTPVIVALGDLVREQGNMDRATSLYRRALQGDPGDRSARRNLVAVLKQTGATQDALNEAGEGIRRFPDDPVFRIQAALLLRAKGDDAGARKMLLEAVKLEADAYDACLNLAVLELEGGACSNAVELLRKCVRLRPASEAAWTDLALAYECAGSPDAEKAYLEAVKLGPANLNALGAYGNYLVRAKRMDEGAVFLQKALEVSPADPRANYLMATVYGEEGDEARAVEYLKRAIESAPGFVPAVNNLAWLMATSTNNGVRDPARALQLADQLLASAGGGDPSVLATVAAAYAADGRFEQAVEFGGKAAGAARARGDEALAGTLEKRVRGYKQNLKR